MITCDSRNCWKRDWNIPNAVILFTYMYEISDVINAVWRIWTELDLSSCAGAVLLFIIQFSGHSATEREIEGGLFSQFL